MMRTWLRATPLFLLGFVMLAPQAEARDFRLTDPNTGSYIEFGAFIQPEFAYRWQSEGDDQTLLNLKRARLDLQGSVYSPNLTFRTLFEFGNANPQVLDAYVNYRFNRMVQLRFGRDLVRAHHQRNTSPATQLFPERNILHNRLSAPGGRDIGLALRGTDGQFSYHLGLYQGDRSNAFRSAGDHMVAGRLVYALLGPAETGEVPIGSAPPGAVIGLGGLAAFGNTWQDHTFGIGSVGSADIYRGFGDLRIRIYGLLLTAELAFSAVDPDDEEFDSYVGLGWNVTAGYAIGQSPIVLFGRYGNLREDLDASDDDTRTQGWGGGMMYLHDGTRWYTRLSYSGVRSTIGPDGRYTGEAASDSRVVLDHVFRF